MTDAHLLETHEQLLEAIQPGERALDHLAAGRTSTGCMVGAIGIFSYNRLQEPS